MHVFLRQVIRAVCSTANQDVNVADLVAGRRIARRITAGAFPVRFVTGNKIAVIKKPVNNGYWPDRLLSASDGYRRD